MVASKWDFKECIGYLNNKIVKTKLNTPERYSLLITVYEAIYMLRHSTYIVVVLQEVLFNIYGFFFH